MSETNETKKPYSAMNASEKTKHLGFKHFSDKELNQRQKDAEARRIVLFRKILGDFLALPTLRLGKHVTEEQFKEVYQDTINNFYQWAIDEGYTGNDLKATVDNIIMISAFVNRAVNQINVEETCFNYAFTGENNLSDLPLKKLIAMSAMGMETRPDEPVIEDEVEEVKDVEVADPNKEKDTTGDK